MSFHIIDDFSGTDDVLQHLLDCTGCTRLFDPVDPCPLFRWWVDQFRAGTAGEHYWWTPDFEYAWGVLIAYGVDMPDYVASTSQGWSFQRLIAIGAGIDRLGRPKDRDLATIKGDETIRAQGYIFNALAGVWAELAEAALEHATVQADMFGGAA